MNPKRPTPRHIIIQMEKVKNKERILKAAREKQSVIYKRTHIRLSADFSAETFQARKDWHDIFTVLKGKKPYKLDNSIQQGYHSELRKRERASQTSKN